MSSRARSIARAIAARARLSGVSPSERSIRCGRARLVHGARAQRHFGQQECGNEAADDDCRIDEKERQERFVERRRALARRLRQAGEGPPHRRTWTGMALPPPAWTLRPPCVAPAGMDTAPAVILTAATMPSNAETMFPMAKLAAAA